MTNADAAHKITRAHHSRKAVVYLRQSSLAQVKHNTESQRLQYALAETAKLYGFRHIEVIDRDLGLSAASGAPGAWKASRSCSQASHSARWAWCSVANSRGSRAPTRIGVT